MNISQSSLTTKRSEETKREKIKKGREEYTAADTTRRHSASIHIGLDNKNVVYQSAWYECALVVPAPATTPHPLPASNPVQWILDVALCTLHAVDAQHKGGSEYPNRAFNSQLLLGYKDDNAYQARPGKEAVYPKLRWEHSMTRV